jgi:ATP-binding cassette subfamily B protein
MADRILVLEAGRLIEEGTHDALVAAGGVYADLFQLQAAGYR